MRAGWGVLGSSRDSPQQIALRGRGSKSPTQLFMRPLPRSRHPLSCVGVSGGSLLTNRAGQRRPACFPPTLSTTEPWTGFSVCPCVAVFGTHDIMGCSGGTPHLLCLLGALPIPVLGVHVNMIHLFLDPKKNLRSPQAKNDRQTGRKTRRDETQNDEKRTESQTDVHLNHAVPWYVKLRLSHNHAHRLSFLHRSR